MDSYSAEDVTESDALSYLPNIASLKSYKMDHASRGKVIIFNHKYFQSSLKKTREGTEEDVKNLQRALLKLGFKESDIKVYNDLTYSKLLSKLLKVQRDDHTDRDLLMIFILSHGGSGDKISAYDSEYSVDCIWDHFTADKCTTLAGKPKIFFVIACRGDCEDSGVIMLQEKPETEVDATVIKYAYSYSIPIRSDFIYVYSTHKGYFSHRNIKSGTWYIQAFCNQLESEPNISEISFTDFLSIVNGRVAFHNHHQKQAPIFSSTLTKPLYLLEKKNAVNKSSKSTKYGTGFITTEI